MTTSGEAGQLAGDLQSARQVVDGLVGGLRVGEGVVSTHAGALRPSYQAPPSARLLSRYEDAVRQRSGAALLLEELAARLAGASQQAMRHAEELARLERAVGVAEAQVAQCEANYRSVAWSSYAIVVPPKASAREVAAAQAAAQAQAQAVAQAAAAVAGAQQGLDRARRMLLDADGRWRIGVASEAAGIDGVTQRLAALTGGGGSSRQAPLDRSALLQALRFTPFGRPGMDLSELVARARSGRPLTASEAARLDPDVATRFARRHPDLAGNLDGLPVALRVEANRLRIQRDLKAETDPGRRALLRSWLTPYQDIVTGDRVRPQILLYDPARSRVAVAFGNLASARYVAVAVPGTGTGLGAYRIGPANRRGLEADRAARLREAMVDVGGTDHVAVIAWLGYDAPTWGPAHNPGLGSFGTDGGGSLAAFVGGLGLQDAQRVTVLGHSYGSYVAGEALKQGLVVDNVVVMGSPGMGVNHVRDLHLPAGADVFAMRATMDPVGGLERFGTAPTSPFFGTTRLRASGGSMFTHSDYWTSDNLEQLAGAATDSRVRTQGLPSLGEVVGEGMLVQGRMADDIVDRLQPVLPDQVESWVDDVQTVRRSAEGLASTIASEVIDGAPILHRALVKTVEHAPSWVADKLGSLNPF